MGSNGTALQAAISLAFVMPAAAQPAPNARPMGGAGGRRQCRHLN